MRRAIHIWLLNYVESQYWLIKHQWAREFTGGEWYLMQTALSMPPIWSRTKFTNCQAKCIGIDVFNFGIRKIDQLKVGN